MKARSSPLARIAPGSALKNSLGTRLVDSQSAEAATMSNTSGGSPSMGICRGNVSVGRRPSPGSANGRRYCAISSAERVRRMAPGRTFSMKKLSRRTISSPASERSAFKAGRMFILSQWSQPCGRTIASMNAMPFTASRWRLAQSKPRAEPQSWMTKATRSRTSRASRRASRHLRRPTHRYEPGPLSGSLSESPMPIRSGAMQRPSGCRCGSTLRQRYDEVGLPCSSTMGSPCPTSTYAISLPRTRRRRFWYGNAAEIMFASPVVANYHLVAKPSERYCRVLRKVCSSSDHTFCATPLNTIRGEEVFNRRGNFHDVCLNCEMTCIKELDLCVRQVFSKRLGSRRNKERIILAPDRKQWRLRLTKIFLKFRIELHIRCVVEKQIQLNLFVSRTLQQGRIQCVRLGRNAFWIAYAVRVLPPRSFQCQNVSPEYLSVFY